MASPCSRVLALGLDLGPLLGIHHEVDELPVAVGGDQAGRCSSAALRKDRSIVDRGLDTREAHQASHVWNSEAPRFVQWQEKGHVQRWDRLRGGPRKAHVNYRREKRPANLGHGSYKRNQAKFGETIP